MKRFFYLLVSLYLLTFWLHHTVWLWEPHFLSRDQTGIFCFTRQTPNHCTTREVQVRPFLGVISKRLTLQDLSCGRFDHLQKGHRKLPLCGGNTLWHNSRKLYIIESYQILWVQETHVALSSKAWVFLFLFHEVLIYVFL